MMIFDSSLGIDFRKHHLILTYLKRAFGKIRLIDVGVHPLLPESQKEEREAQSISLINSFISKHQIHRNRVSIAIPREKVIIRFITLPVATKENLRKVLEYETPRFTPFEKGETYFDYQLLKEEKEGLRLLVAFVKRAEVDYHLTLLKKVGIQPLSVQIPSIAALNLFFYHEGPKDGIPTILLDVAEPFVELNLLREREWVESFHLPLPREEKASGIVTLLKRAGIKEDSLSQSTFFVYGSGTEEALVTSLKSTPPIREVLSPPLHRLEIRKEVTNPEKIYASIGLPLRELTQTQFDFNLLPLEMRRKVQADRETSLSHPDGHRPPSRPDLGDRDLSAAMIMHGMRPMLKSRSENPRSMPLRSSRNRRRDWGRRSLNSRRLKQESRARSRSCGNWPRFYRPRCGSGILNIPGRRSRSADLPIQARRVSSLSSTSLLSLKRSNS